jgi:ABC-type nickel/cobalt efflux system permease component RcnA
MLTHELTALTVTAASLGLVHTLLGPDHYLPFIVLSRARGWSLFKTGLITSLCGIGHILSSVILGLIGIALGLAVTRVEAVESYRGNIAAWVLIAFGIVYFAWGVRRAIKNRPHAHFHIHDADLIHSHDHTHTEGHIHVHDKEKGQNLTPWVLFTIFVLGPCEPLIPVLMYPAIKESLAGLIWVTAVFGIVTVLTMLTVVTILSMGVNLLPLGRLDRYVHAMAGLTIFLCGTAIQILGL